MTDDFIKIEVENIDKIIAGLEKFPREIPKYLQGAGKEAASSIILPTVGLKSYPPLTAANQPPVPYYARGHGTQYASGNKGNSENYGKQWYVKGYGLNTEIGNRASYAQWLGGKDTQARAMARIGWRKLYDVAVEKLSEIVTVYQAWVDKCIKDLGL